MIFSWLTTSTTLLQLTEELGCNKCWAFLFSSKQGADRLSVCTDAKAHGGANGAMHKSPKGFNRIALAKKHSRKATPDECKEAGWVSSGKRQKK